MRQEKEQEIDGLQFSIQQMPGKRATLMAFKLSRIVGPAFARLAANDKDLSGALGLLMDKLTPEEFTAMQAELLETAYVQVDGKKLPLMRVYDDVLAGKVGTAAKVLKFSLEVNFGDFFGPLLAQVQARAAVTTPQTIPGPATA